MSPKIFPKKIFIIQEATSTSDGGGGGSAGALSIDSDTLIDWDDLTAQLSAGGDLAPRFVKALGVDGSVGGNQHVQFPSALQVNAEALVISLRTGIDELDVDGSMGGDLGPSYSELVLEPGFQSNNLHAAFGDDLDIQGDCTLDLAALYGMDAQGNLTISFLEETLYDESVGEEAYVEGFSQNDGSVSKNADHLHALGQETGVSAGVSERTWVTDFEVDVTQFNTAFIDWENDGDTHDQNISAFVFGGLKNGDFESFDERQTKSNTFARTEDSLDISSLTGSFFIRVHARNNSGLFRSESSVRAYKIRLVQ